MNHHALFSFCALLPTAALLSACLDCSQAGCTAQLEIDVRVDSPDPLMLEVCRGETCYGPMEVPTTGVQLAYTDDLYLEAARRDELGGGDRIAIAATEYDDRMATDGPPSDIEWTVRLSDASGVVLEQSLRPSYVRSFPNGETCGPTCYDATHEIQGP